MPTRLIIWDFQYLFFGIHGLSLAHAEFWDLLRSHGYLFFWSVFNFVWFIFWDPSPEIKGPPRLQRHFPIFGVSCKCCDFDLGHQPSSMVRPWPDLSLWTTWQHDKVQVVICLSFATLRIERYLDKFKDEYPKAGNEQRFKCGCRVTALLPWEVIQHCRNEGRWCRSFCKLLQFERLTVAVRRAKDGDVRRCTFSSSFCKVLPWLRRLAGETKEEKESGDVGWIWRRHRWTLYTSSTRWRKFQGR